MNNKKILLGLTVLVTPFVVENIVEENVASANQITVASPKQTVATTQVAQPNEYVLNKPAKAYMTANDAAQRVNQKATYQAGSYHVYNQSKGMVNISKASGKAGSWINPVDNPNAKRATTGSVAPAQTATVAATQAPATPKITETATRVASPTAGATTKSTPASAVTPTAPAQTVEQKSNNGKYLLTSPTSAYVNSADASKQINAKGTVVAGSYHIFREHRGMLNISRVQGKVGSWINPGVAKATTTVAPVPEKQQHIQKITENKPTPTQTIVTKPVAGLFTVTNPTEAYLNAIDASRKVNARGRVSAGNYHIFREYKGMLNISRAAGKPGSWINPRLVETATAPIEETKTTTPVSETKPKSSGTNTTPVPERTVPTQAVGRKTSTGLYALTSATEAYMNVTDASRKVNARGMVSAGNYHIFREYKGMLNISRAAGKPGSWINPNGAVTTVTKLPETASVTKEVSGAGVKYYTQDRASWSSKRYGLGTMHHTGCVPTTIAMAVSTLSKTVTPEQVANYLWNNTTAFNKTVQGTISTGITKALNHYGLKYKVVNTKTGLDTELGKGNMVLSLVQGAHFITPGYTHAVIAKGLDKLGQTTIYNPYSTYGIKKFSTNTLFNSQSKDKDDRRLGGTFISIFK